MSSWLNMPQMVLSILLLGCAATPTAFLEPTSHPQVRDSVISGQTLPIAAQVVIAERKIGLEVAQTQEEQAIGLMYRTTLADDRGMVFLFDPPQTVSFWMKNVRIPLDMIFLRDGKVKEIKNSVPPCTTEPCPTYGAATVDQVIEIRGGRAKELGLRVGDRLEVQFLDSRRSAR